MKTQSVLVGKLFVGVVLLGACAGAPPPAQAPAPCARCELAPAAVAEPVPTGALSVLASVSGGTLVGQGLYLSLDGKPLGLLPGRFEQLPAGQHEVLIQDEQLRYARFTEQVTITKGATTELAPRLVVKKGLLTVRAGEGLEGAHVRLKRADEVRVVSQLPLRIDFPEGQQDYVFEVEAPSGTKQVFPVDFSDGVAIKSLTLTSSGRSP